MKHYNLSKNINEASNFCCYNSFNEEDKKN